MYNLKLTIESIIHRINKVYFIVGSVLLIIVIGVLLMLYGKKEVTINSITTYKNGEKVEVEIISLEKNNKVDKDYFNKEEFADALSKYKENELYQLKYELPNGMVSIKLIPKKDYDSLKQSKSIFVTEKETTIINVEYKFSILNYKTWFNSVYKDLNLAVVNMPTKDLNKVEKLEGKTVPVKEFNKLISVKEQSN